MMQEYTQEQLTNQISALKNVFDEVCLVDPAALTKLDPATMQPTAPADGVPHLDATGRAWLPRRSGETVVMSFYQAIQAQGRPCVLVVSYDLPQSLPDNSREANSFLRLMRQYRDDLCHDYVTGAYNRSFLDAAYRTKVAEAAKTDKVSAAMVRVNEYAATCINEGAAAADRCLNTAAGILQLAIGMEQENNAVVRMEDGVFLVVYIGKSGVELSETITAAMANSRKSFNITLSRRGEFTAAVAVADWAETGNWDMMISLAAQRLANA